MAREASLRHYNGGDSNVPSLVLTQRFISPSIGKADRTSKISKICCANNGRNIFSQHKYYKWSFPCSRIHWGGRVLSLFGYRSNNNQNPDPHEVIRIHNIYDLKMLKNRDIDLKSSKDAANKINLKKRDAASNLPRFTYLVGHCLFILLYWGGNGNR